MGLPFEEGGDPFASQVAANQQMLQEVTGAVAPVPAATPNMLPADFGMPSHLTATTPVPDEGEDQSHLLASPIQFNPRKHLRDLEGQFRDMPDLPDAPDTDYRGYHQAPEPEEGASLDNLSNLYPDNVYGPDGARIYGHGGREDGQMDEKAIQIMRDMRGKPDAEVTVYRAVPEGVDAGINEGDWVTITEDYAKVHGDGPLEGKYKIVKQKAKAKELFSEGNSIHEWAYWPTKEAEAEASPEAELDNILESIRDEGTEIDVWPKGEFLKIQAIRTAEGDRGSGKGAAAMQRVLDYADKHGLITTLSPRPVKGQGLSKKQLTDWYKRLGFVNNTGRNKDFRTRDGMIRKPKDMPLSQEAPSSNKLSEVISKAMFNNDKLSLASVYQRNLALSGEGGDGLIWKPVCKTGTLALSPGPGQVDSDKPLELTPDLFDSVKMAYDDAAIEHVTIPETHGNGVLENTGYVKAVEVLDRESMLTDARIPDSSKKLVEQDPEGTRYLMAGMRFTEPEVKEKVLRGTVANTSVGIKFNYRRKRDGKTYPAVLEHVALTNQPWVDGLVPFGQMMSRGLFSRRSKPEHSVYVDLDTAVAVEEEIRPPAMNPALSQTPKDSPEVNEARLSEVRDGVTIDDKQTTPTVRTRHRNMDKTVEELLAGQQAELEAQQQRAEQLESELALAQGTINAQGEQLHRDRVAKKIGQLQEEGVAPSVLQRAEAIMLADYSTGEGSLSLSISSGEDSEETFQSASDVVEYLLAAVPRGDDASGVAAVMNGLDALSADKAEDDSVETKVDRIRNFLSNGE